MRDLSTINPSFVIKSIRSDFASIRSDFADENAQFDTTSMTSITETSDTEISITETQQTINSVSKETNLN